MERRLGYSFADVRVHTDAGAAESAAEIGASAYTVGRDIFFAAGQFAPDTIRGERTLTHELVHVLQQRNATAHSNELTVGDQDTAYERQAEERALGRNHSSAGLQSAQTAAPLIQRQLYPPIPIAVGPLGPTNEPVEVSAVDKRQQAGAAWYNPSRYTGPLAWLFRGDVVMTSIASMVTNVLAFLQGRNMTRLNVMDHGNAHLIKFGDDKLSTAADVKPFAGDLGKLSSRFVSGAFVHMQNCQAGQNRDLICALASAFAVPVYGGTGDQNPIYGFNLGDYVRCNPDGTFDPNAGRPSTPSPPPGSSGPVATNETTDTSQPSGPSEDSSAPVASG